MASIINEIKKAMLGRYPVVYLNTSEEERAIEAVRQCAAERKEPLSVISWSCTAGFEGDDSAPEFRDPQTALAHILEREGAGFYVMKDLAEFMDRPAVNRALRDICMRSGAGLDRVLFIVSPRLVLPDLLRSGIYPLAVEPPDSSELLAHLRRLQADYPERVLGEEVLKGIALQLNGLSLEEAAHLMHPLFSGADLGKGSVKDYIHSQKQRLAVTDAGACLEYVPETLAIDRVGGLNYLKEWIRARKRLFSQMAQDTEMPIPRGILIMGISGCGKSLCAKVIANTWGVPLYRLDMNLIFSQLYGNPEAAFHKALQTIEAAAPAVLWIDEIENGLGLLEGGDSNQSHIFSAFLTWLQEKPPLVFVAATANRIEALPAELIRKGRFDQVFFCDLPDAQERAEILAIHIAANKRNPEEFDIHALANKTRDWNAAEIEQAVQGGRIYAENQNRPFTTADIARYIDTIVPLSETMSEQIKRIRDWAWDRAAPASRGKGKGRELSFTDEG